MLNSREILDQEIVIGPIDESNIAQVGIDLNLIKIERIQGGGQVPFEGKTTLGAKSEVKKVFGGELGYKGAVWMLDPGAYDVTFAQGCKIPADKVLLLRQRSSMLRNGTILHSSVFDPGFTTGNIGTVMIVLVPILIEYNARVAQAYVHTCTELAEGDLYDGQFQADKQRKDEK